MIYLKKVNNSYEIFLKYLFYDIISSALSFLVITELGAHFEIIWL